MSAVRKPGKTLLFDTLEHAKKLEAVGIPQKHAETQVRLFSKILEENICSKQDLLETEEQFSKEIKELDYKIKGVDKDLTLQISDAKSEIIKWFIGTFLVSIGIMTGMLALVVRLIHP